MIYLTQLLVCKVAGSPGVGAKFTLKQLCGVSWNNYTIMQRKQAGREFKKIVLNGHLPKVVFVAKSNFGNLYKKI